MHPKTEIALDSTYVQAEIVFDSFVESGKSNVRNSYSTNRHIVIQTDEFDVHIKI